MPWALNNKKDYTYPSAYGQILIIKI